jgi:hypothetical protein
LLVKKDCNGNPAGFSNKNPILDSHVLEVEFDDRIVRAFAANVIAKHIYSQVENKESCYLILDKIIDHQKDSSAIAPENI